MRNKLTLNVADLFAGAGGTAEGLVQACRELGVKVKVTAVNHNEIALQTHAANHPEVTPICKSLDNVDPRKIYRGQQLHMLMASPECTNHSNAKGGKPVEDQSRATAWHVLRWAEALCPEVVLVENIAEFLDWGPLIQKRDSKGNRMYKDGEPWMIPDPDRKGEIFEAWLYALRSCGYHVSYSVVNCADYGDPTTRRRFFLLGRRSDAPAFPVFSHDQDARYGLKPWIPAKDIIDWEFPSQSIFNRKRPLAMNTMNKIIAGLERYGDERVEPFLTILRGTGTTRDLSRPLNTVTAKGTHHGLVEPYLVEYYGGEMPRTSELNHPLHTVTAGGNRFGLVQPLLIGQQSGSTPRTDDKPLPTIATKGAISLVESFLVQYYSRTAPHSVREPLHTVTTKQRFGIVQSGFLVDYYGNTKPHSIDYPIPTILASSNKFGLVQIGLDIYYRMLQPHELAAAMGFPKEYTFCGNKGDKIRQIGNAVPVNTAKALCRAQIIHCLDLLAA
jgi:DNA (cytosine-5)-methyltransferase 1